MKSIQEIINESTNYFNNDLLTGLLVVIAGGFNTGRNGVTNLISDRFGTHTDYKFDVNLQVTGSSRLAVDDTEIIRRSIGHIVEGTIKSILSGVNLQLPMADGNVPFKMTPHVSAKDGYDMTIDAGEWGKANFEIKAVSSADTAADIRKMKNNVTLSDNEKKNADFFLIVEYRLNGNTVSIPAMHIFDKSLAPIKKGSYKKSHLTNDQLNNAITYIGQSFV